MNIIVPPLEAESWEAGARGVRKTPGLRRSSDQLWHPHSVVSVLEFHSHPSGHGSQLPPRRQQQEER
ncbi:hypothetical protein GCM10023160_08850 [Brachybacterium paraconglomeratum]